MSTYIYKRVLKKAPKRGAGGVYRHVKKAKKKQNISNKWAGKFPSYDQKTELKAEIGIITHLQKVTKVLDSYFVEIVARLIW